MEYHTNLIQSMDLVRNDNIVSNETLGLLFMEFINEFKTTHKSYHNQLHSNLAQSIYSITVQLDHINSYNQNLFNSLTNNPEGTIEIFEAEICKVFGIRNFQVLLTSSSAPIKIRELSSRKSNRIAKVQGIVVSTSSIITKPKEIFLTCRTCLLSKVVKDAIPRSCDTQGCPIDPYIVIPEKSRVVDVQYVKIQESFEDIPTGETPRHFSICLEGSLINKISPGNQIKATGIYSIRNTNEKSFSYLKALSVENSKTKLKVSFTEEEEISFKKMARDNIYENIAKSIAPDIFGHEDIKKALGCMSFGGTRRVREDGITLRGDLNILLLGDPGIAKSQMLKFIEVVSPISVYTSGKGSSAAGLTASIIKDRNNDFYLEGGALVLADNGVCCIDEFDKMNENDRVAIHEAMEQQTISIAKAGITTVLNTRTSILAAANPVFGRYDDYKTPAENIEFGSTILSRFDCIFIIKDKSGPNDKIMAEHVLSLHSNRRIEEAKGVIPIEKLRNYIQYAKSKVFPTLSEAAAAKLNKFYVGIRQEVNSFENPSNKKNSIPITVRQLEAIIRLSESLAKMELCAIVTTAHVDEAIRIFQVSTMNAVSQGHTIEGMVRPSFYQAVDAAIEKIKEIMPIGSSKAYAELSAALKVSDSVLNKAVDTMIKQNKFISKDYGRAFVRLP